MSEVRKIITPGDIICFSDDYDVIIEYKLVTAGIGISNDTGNYCVGFWLVRNNDEEETFHPDYEILELLKSGIVWRKGSEENASMARTLEAIRNR